jgi:hypothetical protein
VLKKLILVQERVRALYKSDKISSNSSKLQITCMLVEHSDILIPDFLKNMCEIVNNCALLMKIQFLNWDESLKSSSEWNTFKKSVKSRTQSGPTIELYGISNSSPLLKSVSSLPDRILSFLEPMYLTWSMSQVLLFTIGPEFGLGWNSSAQHALNMYMNFIWDWDIHFESKYVVYLILAVVFIALAHFSTSSTRQMGGLSENLWIIVSFSVWLFCFVTSGPLFLPIVRTMLRTFDCSSSFISASSTLPCWSSARVAMAVFSGFTLFFYIFVAFSVRREYCDIRKFRSRLIHPYFHDRNSVQPSLKHRFSANLAYVSRAVTFTIPLIITNTWYTKQQLNSLIVSCVFTFLLFLASLGDYFFLLASNRFNKYCHFNVFLVNLLSLGVYFGSPSTIDVISWIVVVLCYSMLTIGVIFSIHSWMNFPLKKLNESQLAFNAHVLCMDQTNNVELTDQYINLLK